MYLPRFDIRTYDALRPIRSILGASRSDYNEGLLRPFYVASLQPTLTQVTGNHTLKYGYDLRVLRENFTSNGYQGGRFFFDGTYTSNTTTTTTNSDTPTNADRNRNAYGRDVAAFLFGIPTASSTQSVVENSRNYSVQSVYHGFFLQDDWRLTPKLTLNWGLRYELELGLTERFNRFINGFDLSTSSPVEAAAQAAYARQPDSSNLPVTPSVPRDRRLQVRRREQSFGVGRRPAQHSAARLGRVSVEREDRAARWLRHLHGSVPH